MSQKLINAIKVHAAALDQQNGQPRWATVESYNPANHTAKVTYQPEGVLSGWLPVASPMVGGGFGMVIPPIPGQQVVVIHDSGDSNAGIIMGAAYSTQNLPPTPAGSAVQAGEMALVHSSGSFFHFKNDGSVNMTSNNTVNVTSPITNVTSPSINITATSRVSLVSPSTNMTGNLNVNGNIYVSGDVGDGTGTVARLRADYNAHKHPGVLSGGSSTGLTDHID